MFGWLKKGSEPKTVGEVLDAYGALLENYPLAIMDVSMLPTSKTKMKALLKAMYAKASDPAQQNWIEVGFMFLSKFQDGVGPTPIDGTLSSGNAKTNMQADMAILDKWMPWEKLSLAESEILLAEWKRFKAGEPI